MNLHEYQAKEILKDYGIEIPEFRIASNSKEAADAADARPHRCP